MNISPLIAIVPVVLAVALIIIVVRRNITERRPGEPIEIAGAIPAFVVLMVAVVFIGGMASSIAPYTWDEEDGELTINQDVGTGNQKWDPLGADVKSLVITDKVKSVADGAFDTLTAIEYLVIPDTVESITPSAFGVTLADYLGHAITDLEAGEYVGAGNGTLYYCDASIFTFSSDGRYIMGLQPGASGAKYLGIPRDNGDRTIVGLSSSAFASNANIELLAFSKQSEVKTIGTFVCKECTALVTALLPESIESFGTDSFRGCTALTTFDIPDKALTFGQAMLRGDTSLTSFEIPDGTTAIPNQMFFYAGLVSVSIPDSVTTIGSSAFNGCSALEAIALPASVTEIGNTAFTGCTGITSVSFQAGFAATLTNCFPSWTFYDSDGTTQLDKTVAANLAGYTFQGTASALVKVAPGQLTLSPEQIQIVHLHDQELQTMLDQPSIDPLPFQPTVQTQEQELTA